ncbi:MAG: PQQ-binding-like beta-propeller repeat protein [Bacteroidota bacterium]
MIPYLHFTSAKRTLYLFCFCVWFSIALPAQQELWMSTSDETITAQAAKQPKPKFQIPLGAHHVTQMVPLEEDRLLLGLKKDNLYLDAASYMLVDTEKGEVLWKYPCESREYHLFLISEKHVILQEKTKKKTRLIALDLPTGQQSWEIDLGTKEVIHTPVPDTGILSYTPTKKGLSITYFNLDSGKELWSSFMNPSNTRPAFIKIRDGKAFVFSEQINVLDIQSGQEVYRIDQLSIQTLDPILPAFDDQSFYVTDDYGKLFCFDLKEGRENWQMTLPTQCTITTITPLDAHLILSGTTDKGNFEILSIAKKNIRESWVVPTKEAVTSNFLHDGEQLFFANASTLYSVNIDTGDLLFNRSVTTSGRSFPIALRKIGKNVVHIGELVVAAFNAKEGTLIYKRGFSPIALDLHFNGLDAALPSLEQRLSSQQQYTNSGAGQMASRESAYYQKMANESYSNYLKLRQSNQSGSQMRANMERSRSRIYSSMSRAQSGIAVGLSILELSNALTNYIAQRTTESQLKRQLYYRSSILKVYAGALHSDYVFRPNLEYLSRDNQFVTVDVVALSDGKVEQYYMSPQYLDFGLWNVIDFEKRMLYHHGVGMQPEQYTLYTTKRTPMVRSKTVGTFLIGQSLQR